MTVTWLNSAAMIAGGKSWKKGCGPLINIFGNNSHTINILLLNTCQTVFNSALCVLLIDDKAGKRRASKVSVKGDLSTFTH